MTVVTPDSETYLSGNSQQRNGLTARTLNIDNRGLIKVANSETAGVFKVRSLARPDFAPTCSILAAPRAAASNSYALSVSGSRISWIGSERGDFGFPID
jgi:hypothetical protein